MRRPDRHRRLPSRPPAAMLAALCLSAGGHLLMLPSLTLTPVKAGPLASHPATAQPDDLPAVVRWVQAAPATTRAKAQKNATANQAMSEPGSPPTPALPPSEDATHADEHSVADAQTPDEAPGSAPVYWPARDVDRLALPIAPPDLNWLNGQAWHGGPIRVRLAISAQGQVSQIEILLSPVGAQGVLDALQTALMATPFMPARKAGQDVASVQDIELEPAIP